MKKRSDKIQWGRVFRRSAALFMATVAVWALLTLGGAGAATDAFHALGEDPDRSREDLERAAASSPPSSARSWGTWPGPWAPFR